jgi:poly(glycerol-phosphate) alpha-glucosyltransferase
VSAAQAVSAASKAPSFVYLGRIHPKKNIEALVAAWREAASALEAVGASLTIAGWGEDDHVAQLHAALAGAPSSVRFIGPAYGAEKERLLKDARFVVLPSHSEGLPMVILEGWATSVPAIMTSECNLPEGFAAGAAIECGYTARELAPLLERAATMGDDSWSAMAAAAHALASGPFDAGQVKARWAEHYRSLTGDQAPPRSSGYAA